jgi:glycosyltransferase involved in cell wall biosynthesis
MDKGPADNPTEGLLVLCQLFYPELVSTGQTLTELCEELAGRGLDVEVVCGPLTVVDRKRRVPRRIEHRGVSIRRVWGTRFPKLGLLGRVVNQITYALSVFVYLLRDPSKSPILVLTNPPFLAFICALFRMMGGRPYIYLVFDVYPDTAVKLGLLRRAGLLARFWDLLNGFAFRYASDIVVIGRCMEEVVVGKAGPENSGKVRRIHVWSDDRRIRPVERGENPFIRKWGLEGKFVVGYPGNMGRFHDMETIMEAARVLNGREDVVFLFTGEGHKKRWAVEFSDRWGLKNCRFHGYVEREELKYSLSSVDVGLVSLAAGQEGLSVPSKTYALMAARVPVIAVVSGYSEIARVVSEEECGIIVEPGDPDGLADAISLVYSDRERLELMGRNSRRAIDEKYSLDSAAGSYHELIRGLGSG